jgi:hypothetical protein
VPSLFPLVSAEALSPALGPADASQPAWLQRPSKPALHPAGCPEVRRSTTRLAFYPDISRDTVFRAGASSHRLGCSCSWGEFGRGQRRPKQISLPLSSRTGPRAMPSPAASRSVNHTGWQCWPRQSHGRDWHSCSVTRCRLPQCSGEGAAQRNIHELRTPSAPSPTSGLVLSQPQDVRSSGGPILSSC